MSTWGICRILRYPILLPICIWICTCVIYNGYSNLWIYSCETPNPRILYIRPNSIRSLWRKDWRKYGTVLAAYSRSSDTGSEQNPSNIGTIYICIISTEYISNRFSNCWTIDNLILHFLLFCLNSSNMLIIFSLFSSFSTNIIYDMFWIMPSFMSSSVDRCTGTLVLQEIVDYFE